MIITYKHHAACALLLALCSCADDVVGGGPYSYDDLVAQTKRLAGPRAISCGEPVGETLTSSPDESDARACLLRNLKANEAAYAIFLRLGTDSVVADSVAISAQGKAHRLDFDSDPSGGGAKDRGTLYLTTCDMPQVVTEERTMEEVIACAVESTFTQL